MIVGLALLRASLLAATLVGVFLVGAAPAAVAICSPDPGASTTVCLEDQDRFGESLERPCEDPGFYDGRSGVFVRTEAADRSSGADVAGWRQCFSGSSSGYGCWGAYVSAFSDDAEGSEDSLLATPYWCQRDIPGREPYACELYASWDDEEGVVAESWLVTSCPADALPTPPFGRLGLPDG